MEPQRICGICGDKALGYNFNALTCESCKAFFRRNALRNKNFRCTTDGNCVLNIKTRKYCRRCRLNKCFEIGMKKDWILTEEDKILKRRGRNHRIRRESDRFLDADSSQQLQSQQNDIISQTQSTDSSLTTTTTITHIQLGTNENMDNSFNDNDNNNNNNKTDLHEINNNNNNSNIKTNIIILPIMPMAMITKKSEEIFDMDVGEQQQQQQTIEKIQTFNKSEIINFINEKLGLNLPNTIDNNEKQEYEQQQHQQQSSSSSLLLKTGPKQEQQQNENRQQEHASKKFEFSFANNNNNNEDSLISSTKNLHLISEKNYYNNNDNAITMDIPLDTTSYSYNSIYNNNNYIRTNGTNNNTNTTSSSLGDICQNLLSCSSSSSLSSSSSSSSPSSTTCSTIAFSNMNLLSPIQSNDNSNSNNNNNISINCNYNNNSSQQQQQQLVDDNNLVNLNFSQCLNNASLDTTNIKACDNHDFNHGLSQQGLKESTIQQQQQFSTSSSLLSTSNNNCCYELNNNSSSINNNNNNSSNNNNNNNEQSLGSNFDWHISDKVYKNALELEFTANPLNPCSVSQSDVNLNINNNTNTNNNKNSLKLNELEEKKLQEVNEQLAHWYDVGDNPNQNLIITDIYDGLTYFESAIKKIIMSVKNIPSFKNMCQEDQILLLKSSASTIKFVINLRFLNPTQESCVMPNPNDQQNSRLIFEREYLQRTYGVELYSRCRNFCLSFREDWRNDVSILNLLAMILLFYPYRSNLLHREYINLEYISYCHLLQRYLQFKYGSICEAKTIYLNLLSRLEEISYINDQCMDLVFKLDPKNIGPLILELWNINK